jgi:hypothetical protein
MKKESFIGFCLFASFLYGINNILKITFNVKDKTQSEVNDDYDDLDKIDILINEINIIEFEDDKNKELLLEKVISKEKVGSESLKINDDESSMIRTIENERLFTINNMIDKKKYLIELNDKLTDIKTSLTNLKNEMEFCNSTTFYL